MESCICTTEHTLKGATEGVYKTTRGFERKLSEGQGSLQEMTTAFQGLSSVLGSLATRYTEDDDKTGNASKLEKAAEFAAASGDVFSKMAESLDGVVAKMNVVAQNLGSLLKQSGSDLTVSAVPQAGGKQIEGVGMEDAAVEMMASSLMSVYNALKQLNETGATAERLAGPMMNEAKTIVGLFKKSTDKDADKTPTPRSPVAAVKQPALPTAPLPALPSTPMPADERKKKFLLKTEHTVEVIKEHGRKFAKQLELYDELFKAFSSPERSPLPTPKNGKDKVGKACQELLDAMAEKAPKQTMKAFAEKVMAAKNVNRLCAVIGEYFDLGTAADVLLSRLSFVDMIDIIGQFQSVSTGADAAKPYLRRGVLRLGSFEQACVAFLQNKHTLLRALETAMKVTAVKSIVSEFTSKNNVTPRDVFEAPSRFLHDTVVSLNELAMLDMDADEADLQMVDVTYAAFKQFVLFYDRTDEVLYRKNLLKQFEKFDEHASDEHRPLLIEPGRRLLFTEKVTYVGAYDNKQGKGSSQVGGRLSRSIKYTMCVFSDLLMFLPKKSQAIVWPMNEISVCERVVGKNGELDPKRFIVQDKLNGLYNVFRYKHGGDVVASVVARLHTALASHQQNTVFGKKLSDLADDPTLSSDGIPRFVAHAVAWILANDMQVEGPFRRSANLRSTNSEYVMLEHKLLPTYTHHEPEAMLKRWLCQLPGRLLRYTSEWGDAAEGPDAAAKLANLINTSVAPAERKLLALLVAVAHCIVRHQATTNLKFDTISTVMAQNAFLITGSGDAITETTGANKVFSAILTHTDTPEKFRTMFESLFVEPTYMLDSSITPIVHGQNTAAAGVRAISRPTRTPTPMPSALRRSLVQNPCASIRRSRQSTVLLASTITVPKTSPRHAPAAAATAAAVPQPFRACDTVIGIVDVKGASKKDNPDEEK